MHPFMPFITEEIWHLLRNRREDESIMISQIPPQRPYNASVLTKFGVAEEVVTAPGPSGKRRIFHSGKPLTSSYRKNNNEKPETTFDSVVANYATS
jgi:valyl-tRNA synthetase